MEENVIQIKSGITINVDASTENIIYVKKVIFGILLHVVKKMVNSVITCDEIIDTEAKSFDEETKIYILLAFLLISIVLLIAVSIYCYLIKYKSKQKHLLPYYVTNNQLKEVIY